MQSAIKKLKAIAEDYSRTDLVRYVAGSIIDHLDGYDNPSDFFSDLGAHGCISGMIGELVYYDDTRAFYDYHYSDIEQMRYDWKEETGEDLKPEADTDLKNWYAWVAYEETARKLADELGI